MLNDSRLYKICFNTICHNIVDNLNYCKYYFAKSITLGTTDEFERICNPENDEDCVLAFEKVGDEYDVTFTAKNSKYCMQYCI